MLDVSYKIDVKSEKDLEIIVSVLTNFLLMRLMHFGQGIIF